MCKSISVLLLPHTKNSNIATSYIDVKSPPQGIQKEIYAQRHMPSEKISTYPLQPSNTQKVT